MSQKPDITYVVLPVSEETSAAKEHNFRLVQLRLYSDISLIRCTALLIYSTCHYDQVGWEDQWWMRKNSNGYIELPYDTVLFNKGIGIGTLMRDCVIDLVKRRWPELPVMRANLSYQDGQDNFERRHRFYEAGGFDIHYDNKEDGVGFISAKEASQLRVSREFSEYKTLDIDRYLNELHLIDEKSSEVKKNFERYYEKSQKEINALMQSLFNWKWGGIIVGGFLIGYIAMSIWPPS